VFFICTQKCTPAVDDYFNLGYFKTEKLRDREHCNHFTGEALELLKQIPYE